MKSKIYSLAIIAFCVFNLQQVNAQVDAVQLLRAGKDDGNKLMNAYLGPLFDGFGASLNNGWYNTAKPHGIAGFDVSFTYSLPSVSAAQKTFDANSLNLNSDPKLPRMVLLGSNGSSVSTLFGSSTDSTQVRIIQRLNQSDPLSDSIITSFKFPPGLGTNFGIGLPTLQAAIGVGFGTEVMLRITPKLTAGDFKAGMFGFGIKHGVSQWIWKDKKDKPPVDISAIFGYTSLFASLAFNDSYLKPDSAYPFYGALPDNDYKESQKMSFTGSGFMIGAVVSKKLSLLTVYLGGNYNTSKINLKMEGQYPVSFIETNIGPNLGKKMIINISDPINIESKLNYMRFTAGVRIKLAILTINCEYNLAKVSTINFGLGINLQSVYPFKL